MIKVYNKYNKLVSSFEKINNLQDAINRCKELKIVYEKIINEVNEKLFTYYCTDCKKRSYFKNNDETNCNHCKQSSNLFFVGFKQTNNIIEEIFICKSKQILKSEKLD